MHAAQGILLDLTADSAVAEAAPDQADLITVITAHCLTRPAPAAALLIRPDGHVAWAAGPGTPDPAADRVERRDPDAVALDRRLLGAAARLGNHADGAGGTHAADRAACHFHQQHRSVRHGDGTFRQQQVFGH